jgi:hypothetical protein
MNKKLIFGILGSGIVGYFVYKQRQNSTDDGTGKGWGDPERYISIQSFWNKLEANFNNYLIDSNTREPKQYQYFERILNFWAHFDQQKNIKRLAYILATVIHESKLGHSYWTVERTSGIQYEDRDDLGNTQTGDGPRFKGRGPVQITGRHLYQKLSNDYNRFYNPDINLISSPSIAATDVNVGAFIAVYGMLEGRFTTRKLSRYINSNETDYYNARRTVNSTNRASHIKSIAESIENLIEQSITLNYNDTVPMLLYSSNGYNTRFIKV